MPTAVYATLQQVRDFGVSTSDASDAVVTDALVTGSRWVEEMTEQEDFGFGAPVVGATVTLWEVTGPMISLPAPLSAITAVLTNGSDHTGGDLTPFVVGGVDNRILRYAPNGFLSQIGGRTGARVGGYAASLTITGTWGYPTVTGLISKAAWLYAAYQVLTPAVWERIQSEHMGNYSVSYATGAGTTLEDMAIQALLDGGFLTAVLA